MKALRLLVLAAAVACAVPAQAEQLIMSLSSHRVIITSNFTGAEVVLFGAIQPDAGSVGRAGDYDLVITLRGPRSDATVRRKERMLGAWVNWGSRTFPQVPEYLAVVSSRPLDDVASPALQRRFTLSLTDHVPLPVNAPPEELATIIEEREALIRLKQQERRFIYNPTGVAFLNRSLFRASIPLPANVPIGAFEAEARLFLGGVPLAVQTSALEVVKAGFEADVADLSRERPWTFGFMAVFLALASGWLASVAFRRD